MEAYQKLEEEWEKWVGVPNVVAVASGSAALHVAIEALQLPPRSRVIVPNLTMIACARAVTLAGHEPVFVECGPDLCLNPDYLPQALGMRTAAIMAVHIYGRPCNMNKIGEFARKNDLWLIEDMAEAPTWKPHLETDAVCWSFYKNKIVAGEEGGAVAFPRNRDYARRARGLRCFGYSANHDFMHEPRGWNHRMSNIHAKLVLESLRLVDQNVIERCRLVGEYDKRCPAEWRMPPRTSPWVYDLRIPGLAPNGLDDVVGSLRNAGIQARHCFKPMDWQDEYVDCPVAGRGESAKAASEVFYLPVEPGQTTEMDMDRAFAIIQERVANGTGVRS